VSDKTTNTYFDLLKSIINKLLRDGWKLTASTRRQTKRLRLMSRFTNAFKGFMSRRPEPKVTTTIDIDPVDCNHPMADATDVNNPVIDPTINLEKS
jgi:hypothetical protein